MAASQPQLVLGGEGFLGHHLVAALIRACPDRTTTSMDLVQRHPIAAPHAFIQADLTSLDSLLAAFENVKPHTVFHTASPWIGSGKAVCEKVNILGTSNVVEACRRTGVSRLVYTSSAGVVYNGHDLINVDERLPVPDEALDDYNVTKVGKSPAFRLSVHQAVARALTLSSQAKAEAIVLEANGKGNLLTCALRPAGIFGPGDRQAIPGIIQVLKNGQHRIQIGQNKNLFDWTYIDNVVEAHLLAASKLESSVPLSAFGTFLPQVSLTNMRRPIPTSRSGGTSATASATEEEDVELVEFPGSSETLPKVSQPEDLLSGELDEQLAAKRTKWDQWASVSAAINYPEAKVSVAGQAFFITGGEPVFFWDFTRAVWMAYSSAHPELKLDANLKAGAWVIPKSLGILLAFLAQLWSSLMGKPAGFTPAKVHYACAGRFFNIEKARVVLGYQPLVGVEEGIRRAVEWYVTNETREPEPK